MIAIAIGSIIDTVRIAIDRESDSESMTVNRVKRMNDFRLNDHVYMLRYHQLNFGNFNFGCGI